jgi:hypothetical protein
LPSPQSILNHLGVVANEAAVLAIAWHIVGAAAVAALLLGWRPSARGAQLLLAVPITSAAAVAFAFGNPFNGTLLAALALTLIGLASRSRSVELIRGSLFVSSTGALLIAFGLFYPHFLETRSLVTYLYAAPTGLIPCPTLSVVIGFALLAGAPGTRAWSLTLAAFGLFYGLFGVVRLQVLIDGLLLFGAAVLAVVTSSKTALGSFHPTSHASAPRGRSPSGAPRRIRSGFARFRFPRRAERIRSASGSPLQGADRFSGMPARVANSRAFPFASRKTPTLENPCFLSKRCASFKKPTTGPSATSRAKLQISSLHPSSAEFAAIGNFDSDRVARTRVYVWVSFTPS